MAERVGSIFFDAISMEAHDDPSIDEKDPAINAQFGTKLTGVTAAKWGPFRCDTCIHFSDEAPLPKQKGKCDNTHVLKDKEVPDFKFEDDGKERRVKALEPAQCCGFWWPLKGPVPASAKKAIEAGWTIEKLCAAAELPDIEGFDKDTTNEIRDYLIKFPRKLLHHCQKVVACPELGAIHGRYKKEDQTILLNPANFSNKLKFGTHNPADIDEHVLAHELGHGLFLSLSPEEQDAWMKLSGWHKGDKEGQASPYVEKRPGWPPSVSNWTHSKDAKFARLYQGKSPNEDFADNVGYISTGNGSDVPKEKREFLENYLH